MRGQGVEPLQRSPCLGVRCACMAQSKAPSGQSDVVDSRPAPRIHHRMGELAVELLLTEIRQPADHAHQTLTLDPHLIPRRSTQQGLRT